MALVINSMARVIKTAYQNNKQLAAAQEPSSLQYQQGFNRLCDMIAFMNTQGQKLFMLVDTAVTLTAGQAVYTFSPTGTTVMTKPERVDQAWYQDNSGASNTRRPLTELSWQEWSYLSGTNQQGSINQYLQERLATQLRVTLWCVPDSTQATNGQLHLLLRCQIPREVQLTDDTQFPQEWFLALSWLLADELSSGLAMEIQQKTQAKAEYYRNEMLSWDVETAEVFFTPDSRGAYERSYP